MKNAAPVPIAGLGCICALGNNLQECMDSMYAGHRNFTYQPQIYSSQACAYPVFEVHADFFAQSGCASHQIRTWHLVMAAVHEALSDAGLDAGFWEGKKVGVCIGTNVNGSLSDQEILGTEDGQSPGSFVPPEHRFALTDPSLAIGKQFSLSGPLQTVVTACSAGSDAIGLAGLWIQLDICDIVISGGVDELYRTTYDGFASLMNSDKELCRPFDANRNGLNLGEGAGIVILESERSLADRGKKPRACIWGYGSASDAYHLTSPSPDGKGLSRAIQEALDVSGLPAWDIGFINAHGTGTVDNDRIEARVLHDFFPLAPFFSTKGYTGHTLGAAGAVEVAFTVACLENKKLPASAGFAKPDPDLAAAPVFRPLEHSARFGLSETLAFGGINSVLVVGKADASGN